MKKTVTVVTVVLSLLLVFTLSLLIAQTANAKKSRQIIYSSYNKSFYELIENIEKIDVALKKAALSSDSHSLLRLGSVIRESASFSLSDLCEMESDTPLTNISKFLNQSGDYVRSVAAIHSDGSSPTKEEQDVFLLLSRFSGILKDELYSLRDMVSSGELSYSAALKDADETLGSHLSRIEDEHFSSYEALSYDGHFSSHMEERASVYLPYFSEITKEEALNAAFSYLSGNVPFVYSGETTGSIPSFMFYADSGESHYSIEIAKQGGKLLYYSESRTVSDPVVGTEEAVYHALSFAENSGYTSLAPVFYENSGGILLVTLAPMIEDIIYYTDLIKVEVALDSASVVGFNAEDYLMNHKTRAFPNDYTTAYEALSNTNKDFFLRSLKNAFIPTEYGSEVPCLEALGDFGGETYLIYINVQTGLQEEILLISESDSGYFAK